jgi:hypothetical protein
VTYHQIGDSSMSTSIECSIEITKGDPQKFLTAVLTKPELTVLFTSPGDIKIETTSDLTPDLVFDELAAEFPEHEFTVNRGFDVEGFDDGVLLVFRGGKYIPEESEVRGVFNSGASK